MTRTACQNEGQRDDGQAGVRQHVAKGGTDTGIHQDLLEHATGTGHQDDDASRLNGAVADVHHLVTGHAATDPQQVEGGQAGDHDGGEGVADELQPAVQRRAGLDEAVDDGLETDQQQRQTDEAHGQPEGGQVLAVVVGAALGVVGSGTSTTLLISSPNSGPARIRAGTAAIRPNRIM